MEALIVKIDKNHIDALEDTVNGSIVQVEKSKRPAVARLSFHVGHVQHVRKIQNIRMEVDAIDTISDIAGQVREIRVAHEFLDLDVIYRQLINFSPDAICRSLFLPGASRHDSQPLLVKRNRSSGNSPPKPTHSQWYCPGDSVAMKV